MSKAAIAPHSSWDARKWGKQGRRVAPAVLSILALRARDQKFITYGELAAILEQQGVMAQTYRKTFYGSPAGLVGYVLQYLGKEWGELLPPLNLILINKATKKPGSGADPLLKDYAAALGKKLTKSSRKSLVGEGQRAVFAYGDRWEKVVRTLDAKVLKPAKKQRLELPKLPEGGHPEGEKHKALKKWVKNHPVLFSAYGMFGEGVNEKRISSGDKLDAYFENGLQRLAVEVKPHDAPKVELERGVYQAVKYRAVMRAEQRALLRVPNAQALLVTTTQPSEALKALLDRLNVEHIRAPKSAEK